MPNRLMAQLTHCFPFPRSVAAAAGDAAPPPGARPASPELLRMPLAFQRRLEEGLSAMDDWPREVPLLETLRGQADELLATGTHTPQMSPSDVHRLMRWLAVVEEGRQAWERMPCVKAREVDTMATQVRASTDERWELALLEQLALAREAESRARAAFGDKDWRGAQAQDQRARLHCDVARNVLACMRSGGEGEQQTMRTLLAQGAHTGAYEAAANYRPSVVLRSPGPLRPMRVTSLGNDSLFSLSDLAAAQRRLEIRDGAGFQTRLNDVRRRVPNWPEQGRLATRVKRSLDLLSHHGPRRADQRADPPSLQELDRLEGQVMLAEAGWAALRDLLGHITALTQSRTHCPQALREALRHREAAARYEHDRARLALLEGDMPGIDAALSRGSAITKATQHLIDEVSRQSWGGALRQLEQREMLSESALQLQGGRLSLLQLQWLESFVELLKRFDHAGDEAEASHLLYEMEITLDKIKRFAAPEIGG